MPDSGRLFDSLRPGRLEGERLLLALAISLAVHLIGFGGYEFGKSAVKYSPWLRSLVAAKLPQKEIHRTEEPVEFVMVQQPSTEAPKNAKYISNQNSRAANPEAKKQTENPELNGKQTDIAMTETAPRQPITQPQPQPSAQESQPRPANTPGDLTLGKPDKSSQHEPQRPRTIQQALAMRHMPGLQMKQDGGVQRKAVVPSFDVKITGFGDYDARFIQAVSQRWWNLLDSQHFALDRSGKVVLLFHLNYDGSITDMRFGENSVGDLLGYVCEKAVMDGAPYERWPSDMRLKLGDHADVQFTFYYY
ncbi:MAG TPA: hypothetical protein VFV23_02275 [Verrucomicrobiae bacterium]|nr:hypothetical protein [Verrucomicrobiae bacterium]